MNYAEGSNTGTYAWKNLDVDLYGRLLKSNSWDSWSCSGTITQVKGYAYPSLSNSTTPDVTLRAYDTVAGVIANQTINNLPQAGAWRYGVTVSAPGGSWSKSEVDSLQLWVGSAERKATNLRVHAYKLVITVQPSAGEMLFPGDVVADGVIDLYDVLRLVDIILEDNAEELSPETFAVADIDSNDVIDIFDLLALIDLVLE